MNKRVTSIVCLVLIGVMFGWLFAFVSFKKEYHRVSPHASFHSVQHKKISKTPNKVKKSVSKVEIYKINDEKLTSDNRVCSNMTPLYQVYLKTPAGQTPIFIHNPDEDLAISRFLQREGVWEEENIKVIYSLLESDTESNFIDLGANVGVFTLSVAKLGRKVIAVDPLSMNLKRLCASIVAGNFTDKVILINNALSDVREKVTLMADNGNIGGTFVAKDNNPNKVKGSSITGNFKEQVQTMILDDLLKIPNFDFKKVIMKMDVEGYENRVLRGGEKFFKTVDVTAILMEWLWLKTGEVGLEIINFLTSNGFYPTTPTQYIQTLEHTDRKNWPNDVLWRKTLRVKEVH